MSTRVALEADSGHRAYFGECLKLGDKLPFRLATRPSRGMQLSLFHKIAKIDCPGPIAVVRKHLSTRHLAFVMDYSLLLVAAYPALVEMPTNTAPDWQVITLV